MSSLGQYAQTGIAIHARWSMFGYVISSTVWPHLDIIDVALAPLP
jgi:hypothetical protein